MSIAFVKRVAKALSLDRAVVYTLLGRGWNFVAGALSLYFVARFLSPSAQGFYYTFTSILGLQVVFELGLALVILQTASHECAHLEWGAEGVLVGDAVSKARLASLLRLALRWYGVVGVIFVFVVAPVGVYFFSQHAAKNPEVVWGVPWVWSVLATGAMLSVSPLAAFLEGCGLVAEVALMRLCQACTGAVLFWMALFLGFKLFAAPLMTTASVAVAVIWIWSRKAVFLRDLLAAALPTVRINWWKEVWPLQWRIAVSWLSGYFQYQLFNPVLFAYHGAKAAGQMGMSLNALMGLTAVSMAWVQTKAAPMGMLIARKAYQDLDALFTRSLFQSTAIAAILGAVFWRGAAYIQTAGYAFGDRILPSREFALLVATTVVNVPVLAMATYLRAHKKEPFLALSVVNGAATGLSTFFLGRAFGPMGMVAGYLVINLIVGLGWGTSIFLGKRREWHQEGEQCA